MKKKKRKLKNISTSLLKSPGAAAICQFGKNKKLNNPSRSFVSRLSPTSHNASEPRGRRRRFRRRRRRRRRWRIFVDQPHHHHACSALLHHAAASPHHLTRPAIPDHHHRAFAHPGASRRLVVRLQPDPRHQPEGGRTLPSGPDPSGGPPTSAVASPRLLQSQGDGRHIVATNAPGPDGHAALPGGLSG